MLHASFDGKQIMTRLAKMADNISKLDVDAIMHDALDALADVLLAEMQELVRKHYKTGDAYRAIKRTEVQRAGNYQWVEVGALHIRAEDKDGFHVVYQEYGSPGRLEADPWLRPVMEDRGLINRTILDVFSKWGISNVKVA